MTQPDRFFARVRAADLECPHCGAVSVLTARGSSSGGTWRPDVGAWTCGACGRRFLLGVVAWPVRLLDRIPDDRVPTPAQALALRAAIPSAAMNEKPARNRVNLRASTSPQSEDIPYYVITRFDKSKDG